MGFFERWKMAGMRDKILPHLEFDQYRKRATPGPSSGS